MRKVILHYPNCMIEGYMNNKGEFATKDGVLLTMVTDPTTIQMLDEDIPDIEFKGKKYISTNKEELLALMNTPTTIIQNNVQKLEEVAQFENKPVGRLEEKEEEKEEEEKEDSWIDLELDEDAEAFFAELLEKYSQ